MTTGEQGRTVPDAEHYLDLSDVEDDSPGPHFDVVLRGYDRRQVDEHVAGLRRMVAQLRAQLAVHDRRRAEGEAEPGGGLAGAIPQARVASGDEPVAGDEEGDTVGVFNDRLQAILQAAEQEAQAVRSRAAETLLAEHAESRAALAELRSQRDGVVDELVRLRGWLDEIVSHPGRAPSAPPPAMGRGPRPPWGAPPPGGPPPGAAPPNYGGPPPGFTPPPSGQRPAPVGRPWPEGPERSDDDPTGVSGDTLPEAASDGVGDEARPDAGDAQRAAGWEDRSDGDRT